MIANSAVHSFTHTFLPTPYELWGGGVYCFQNHMSFILSTGVGLVSSRGDVSSDMGGDWCLVRGVSCQIRGLG